METAPGHALPEAAPRGGVLSRLADSERWLARLMLGPTIVYIAALVGFPFVLALLYSVTNVTVGSQSYSFVGVRNFLAIMESPTFWGSLQNTLVFTIVSQVLVVILAKMLAMALLKPFRGRWLVRLLILMPFVAPVSLSSIGWLWILDSVYSVINWTAQAVGIFGPDTWPYYLGQPRLAMGSIITVHVWRMLPLATVIMLAGLSSIPQDLLDAAEVDGARFWRKLFQVTIPLMLPIIMVALLFGIVFTITDMIVIYVLTRGGPFDSTQVLSSMAYFTGVEGGDLATGAAIALFLFPMLVLVAILMLWVAHKAEVV